MRAQGTIRQIAVYALVLVFVCTGIVNALTAGKRTSSPRLAIVSTPSGGGFEAAISEALVPDQRRGQYRLVPIADLVKAHHADITAGSDAGVDGGVMDPKAATAEQARDAALAFNLVHAAELWRQAADEVMNSETAALDLSLAASYLLEAGAASAAAGEDDLAHTYFRRALGIDLGITPGPEISPDAKTLFRAAQEDGPSIVDIPRDTTLTALCEQLDVDGLVWIAVGNDRGSLIVAFKVFLQGGETSELETRTYQISDKGVAPGWLESEQKRLDEAIAVKLFGPLVTTPKTAAAASTPKKPWYKKWWFYTVVGGVLVAGAAGLTSYYLLREETADVVVHW